MRHDGWSRWGGVIVASLMLSIVVASVFLTNVFEESPSFIEQESSAASPAGRKLLVWYEKWKYTNPQKYERYKRLDDQRKQSESVRAGDEVVDHQLDQKNLELELKLQEAQGTEELVDERKKTLRRKLDELEKVKTMDWQNTKDDFTMQSLLQMRRLELNDAIDRLVKEQEQHEKRREDIQVQLDRVKELLDELAPDEDEVEERKMKKEQEKQEHKAEKQQKQLEKKKKQEEVDDRGE